MDDAQQQDFAQMASPGNEHERLKPFEGTFKAEVRIWMGPGDPQVSTGTLVSSWDLGGRFLRQDYKGDQADGPFPDFEGRGYWGYNKLSGQYEGMWIDNASTVMQTEAGGVDESGKVWTMVGEMPNPQGEGTMTKRSVITLEDDDHHSMEMYFSSPEGEFKAMEIKYQRA